MTAMVTPRDESMAGNSANAFAESLLGVVLAGGQSSRMGSDKSLLIHSNGLTYLQHAIARLRPLVGQVAVSGRASDEPNVRSVPDEMPGQGPAVAVWSAVKFAGEHGFKAVLITPVDMPYLESSQLQQVVDAFRLREPVCVSLDGRMLHPLVAIYPVSLAEELHNEAISPRRSLRAWLESQPHRRIDLCGLSVTDINTPEDRVQSRFRAESR
jgi:molybdenum cofactor guanylyltransferase